MSKVSKTFSVTIADLEFIQQVAEEEQIISSSALRLLLRKAKVLPIVIEQLNLLAAKGNKNDEVVKSLREILKYATEFINKSD